MGPGMDMTMLASKRLAIAFGLLFFVARGRISLASAEHNHNHSPPPCAHRGSLGLHPCTDQSFSGPLAPGLQVSGGSKLKRAARNKLKHAARRVKAFHQEVRVNLPQQQQQPVATTEESTSSMESPVYYNTIDTVASDTQIQEFKPAIVEPPSVPPPPTIDTVTQANNGLPRKAILYMSLLAVQFGVQPILVRRFTPRGICKSSVVLTQECVKGGIALAAFLGSTRPDIRRQELSSLTVRSWLTMAGVPAAIYTVQNLASLLAYQNLEALTFNVLNQTKILSAALCCYLVMGKKQTKVQSCSLVMLLLSALVIEKVVSFKSILALVGGASVFAMPKSMEFGKRFTHGVLPVLLASFLSGLAGALTQKNLQGVTKTQNANGLKPKPKNPFLFSMELTAASLVVLLTSLLVSSDGKQISQNGFFHMWTPVTMIPILTNSFGGILVGLVTKHAGSVKKSFALIFGMVLSGLFQAGSAGISSAQIVGGLLAAISLWLHSSSHSHQNRAVSK